MAYQRPGGMQRIMDYALGPTLYIVYISDFQPFCATNPFCATPPSGTQSAHTHCYCPIFCTPIPGYKQYGNDREENVGIAFYVK